MYALYAIVTKFPYFGAGPVPSDNSMYCRPDFVLKTVTDLPSTSLEDVDSGGAVDCGIETTPSMSALDTTGFVVNIAEEATIAAAVRQAWLMAPLLFVFEIFDTVDDSSFMQSPPLRLSASFD